MAEKITLQGKEASLNGDTQSHVVPISEFIEGISAATLHGMTREPFPDNAKWMIDCGKLKICMIELTPQLRWIKWLADDSPQPFGPNAKYAEYSLATPYVVLKVPFWDRCLVPRIEVFYRARRLKRIEGRGGELYWPNLYNVSANACGCTAWYCSQFLPELSTTAPVQRALDAVVHHLFGGGFNASSEFHEGLSTFGLCVKENVDPRVTDVHRWAEASRQDPRFVLSVKWKSTGLTVKDLIERELKFHKVAASPQTTQALGNILLRKTKPK